MGEIPDPTRVVQRGGPGTSPSALCWTSLGRVTAGVLWGEQRCADDLPLSLVFQSKTEPSLWTCPFHPPLQLSFVIRSLSPLHGFGLAKIKVWNYWTADGVSNWLCLLEGRLMEAFGADSLIPGVAAWTQGGPAGCSRCLLGRFIQPCHSHRAQSLCLKVCNVESDHPWGKLEE